VEDRNNCQSCHPFDFLKTTNLKEGFQEDFPEEEDSPEEGDTQAEEGYHREDHREADGDHHQYPCLKLNKES